MYIYLDIHTISSKISKIPYRTHGLQEVSNHDMSIPGTLRSVLRAVSKSKRKARGISGVAGASGMGKSGDFTISPMKHQRLGMENTS